MSTSKRLTPAQRATLRPPGEKRTRVEEFRRKRSLDRAEKDLPDFGIHLSRDEIDHWLDFAEMAKRTQFQQFPDETDLGVRLWDEGWVLLVAFLYRTAAPDFDVTAWKRDGGPFVRTDPLWGTGKSTLHMAYRSVVKAIDSTSYRVDERPEPNQQDAFPALDDVAREQEDDEKRFDDDTGYEIDPEVHTILRDMMAALSDTVSTLQEKSWRAEVTGMCLQLAQEITPPTQLLRTSELADDGDSLLVPGFLMNYLDHLFSLQQGYFTYLMSIFGLMRGNGIDVENLTGSVVGGFISVSDILDDYAEALADEPAGQK